MPTYRATGIILKAASLGEADKLLTVYTKEFGKLQLAAKGARRIKSKFGGRTEPFVCNTLLIAKAKSIDILTQAETIETFFTIRDSQQKLAFGTYFLYLIQRITFERYVDEDLFYILFNALKALASNLDLEKTRQRFQKQILKQQGLLPEGVNLENDTYFNKFIVEYDIKLGNTRYIK